MVIQPGEISRVFMSLEAEFAGTEMEQGQEFSNGAALVFIGLVNVSAWQSRRKQHGLIQPVYLPGTRFRRHHGGHRKFVSMGQVENADHQIVVMAV